MEARTMTNTQDRDSSSEAADLDSVLPPRDTTRWVIRRKAQVVKAVSDGILSAQDACSRYSLSPEEFETWRTLVEQYGVRGLRATRIQDYREVSRRTANITIED
jgi:hypothetical protein